MRARPDFDIDDIALGGFFRIKRDVNLSMARAAWIDVLQKHGDPEEIIRANGPADWAPYLLTKLRRIEKILLWTLAVCAAFLKNVVMPKKRPWRHRAPQQRRAENPADCTTWRVSFATLPRIGLIYPRGRRMVKPRERNVMRTLARKLEALRRVIIAPERTVLALARRYRRRFVHTGWTPPKRPPPTDRRDYFEDMIALWEDADREINAAVRRLWEPP